MFLHDCIRSSESELATAGIDNPALDARLLIAHALKLERAQLLSQSERELSPDELQNIQQLMQRRLKYEPLSRIRGEREFWSLPFGLNEATLVPRPESETLIEISLKKMTKPPSRLLDLGTGSGCLLLALLHEWPQATGIGVDVEPRALEQAQENAAVLGLADHAKFIVNDWAHNLSGPFNLIISNPPYIAHAEINALMPDVRLYDPHLALDGGDDGLAVYRVLVPRIAPLLAPGGLVVLEIGEGQGEAVAKLCAEASLAEIEMHKDLHGILRCVTARAV